MTPVVVIVLWADGTISRHAVESVSEAVRRAEQITRTYGDSIDEIRIEERTPAW